MGRTGIGIVDIHFGTLLVTQLLFSQFADPFLHKDTRMKTVIRFLVLLFLSFGHVSSEKATFNASTQQVNSHGGAKLTSVVSHEVCQSDLTDEDKTSKSSLEEVHTYAELKDDPKSSLPASFTICSSVMTTECPDTYSRVLFTILSDQKKQLLAAKIVVRDKKGKAGSIFQLSHSQGRLASKMLPPLFSYQWIRSCLAINSTSGHIDWVANGNLVLTGTFGRAKLPESLAGKLILGVDAYKDSTQWYALSNKVANLNIFSTLMSRKVMESMTRGGSCTQEGDYLAWKDMEWNLHGHSKLETVEITETCEGEPWANLYFASFLKLDSCMHHCSNLGTRSPPVTTFEEWDSLQRFLITKLYDKVTNNPDIWLPITDIETEGVWKDFYDDKAVENYTLPWIGSRPNGGRVQNCARVMDKEYWGDDYCVMDGESHGPPKYSCLCSNEKPPILKLRGLCPQSVLNMHYQPMNDWHDIRKLTFQGIYVTIAYDGTWKLKATKYNLTGFSKAPHASFALGKHNWTIIGDKGCHNGEPYTTELKMSTCSEEEFTCDSGQCVPMEKRCNQLSDCRDKSDEKNCKVLVLEEGYNKFVPPIDLKDLMTNVSLSLDLLKLVDINEDDYSIEIQFQITLKWKENRATYHNLKSTDNLNALTQEDIKSLWIPEVIYENTDQKETTDLVNTAMGSGKPRWS